MQEYILLIIKPKTRSIKKNPRKLWMACLYTCLLNFKSAYFLMQIFITLHVHLAFLVNHIVTLLVIPHNVNSQLTLTTIT